MQTEDLKARLIRQRLEQRDKANLERLERERSLGSVEAHLETTFHSDTGINMEKQDLSNRLGSLKIENIITGSHNHVNAILNQHGSLDDCMTDSDKREGKEQVGDNDHKSELLGFGSSGQSHSTHYHVPPQQMHPLEVHQSAAFDRFILTIENLR
jgi:hypothetical protein